MIAHFLTLPYDIRFLIYQHLFPPGEQIYLQAYGDTLHTILPEGGLPTSVLQVCRQINDEASGFLYNGYLFNIIGLKVDCLDLYETFLEPLRKHARHEVRVDAFSNGEHSATMCISLQAGEARTGTLERRRRGEPRDIRELKRKLGMAKDNPGSIDRVPIGLTLCGVLLALAPWLSMSRT